MGKDKEHCTAGNATIYKSVTGRLIPLQGTDEAVPGRHSGRGRLSRGVTLGHGGCPGASPWAGEAVPGRHPGARRRHPGARRLSRGVTLGHGGCPAASAWAGEALSGPDEVKAARRLRSPPRREPSHKRSRGQTRVPVPGPPGLSRSPAPARPGVRTPPSPRRAPGSPALTRSPSARGKQRPPRRRRQFR